MRLLTSSLIVRRWRLEVKKDGHRKMVTIDQSPDSGVRMLEAFAERNSQEAN